MSGDDTQVGRCATCAWWERLSYSPRTWGTCGVPKRLREYMVEWHGELETQQRFGCVLHKPKVVQP